MSDKKKKIQQSGSGRVFNLRGMKPINVSVKCRAERVKKWRTIRNGDAGKMKVRI